MKAVPFLSNWYITVKGLDLWGEQPGITFCRVPPGDGTQTGNLSKFKLADVNCR